MVRIAVDLRTHGRVRQDAMRRGKHVLTGAHRQAAVHAHDFACATVWSCQSLPVEQQEALSHDPSRRQPSKRLTSTEAKVGEEQVTFGVKQNVVGLHKGEISMRFAFQLRNTRATLMSRWMNPS